MDQVPDSPHRVVAERMKELRKLRGWSAEKLAEEMTRVGVPWERMVVTKLENGRRRLVTVQELLALARVLNVAPVHLLVPPHPSPLWGSDGERTEPNDEQPYAVTPTENVPAYLVRRFIRGESPLPGMNEALFYAQIPPQEWSPLIERVAAERRGSTDGER